MYIPDIPGIIPAKIGSYLGGGMHNRVYAYGKHDVLKIPQAYSTFVFSSVRDLLFDLSLIQTYLGFSLVPTKIHVGKRGFVITQKRITKMQYLTPAHVPILRASLQEIIKGNRLLMRQHTDSYDFLGKDGILACVRKLFFPSTPVYCSNVCVVHTSSSIKVLLVDTELLRLRRRRNTIHQYYFQGLSIVSYWMNAYFLRRYFGIVL